MAGITNYKTVNPIDGISFMPLLKGTGDLSKGRALVWNFPNIWVMTDQASIWTALSAKTNGNWSIIMKPVKKNFSTYQMISVKKMM